MLVTLSIGSIGVAAMHFRRRIYSMGDKKIIPELHLTNSGRADKLERFSHYVARQMGFEDMEDECALIIGKLAEDYLRKSQGCEDNLFELFSKDPDGESLYIKLINELDRCILGYFLFHWSHATLLVSEGARLAHHHPSFSRMMDGGGLTSSSGPRSLEGLVRELFHLKKDVYAVRSKVLCVDTEPQRKLKSIVLAATRKQRFERITKDLKVARVFSTLVEEMKAIGIPANCESQCTEVMVPAAHSKRSPVLLLMGGGMGAGKSTVLKDLLKDSFWSEAAKNAVIVEADAFKETDVIYKALSSRGGHHDMLQTAELVHQSSTDAASSLLVTALNEGRDVIMDGTLSWEPFVNQTIAMARNAHHHRYRMGVGYMVESDGKVTENYWDPVEKERGNIKQIKPYRIELVGVVCDAYLAVVRGMRRAIMMGRAVRVKSQLTSHKRFANAFPKYCQLVDNARLYCTNAIGRPAMLIGWKEGANNLLVDPQQIDCLTTLSKLNEEADSVYDVYKHQDPTHSTDSTWKDIVLSPERASHQHELKLAIIKKTAETPPSDDL